MPASLPSGRPRPTPATPTAAWPTTTRIRSTSAPTPRRSTAPAQPAGADACVPDLSSLVEADGSLIGESARSSSNTFDLADPDATVSTDPFAFADSTSIYAVVFVVDEAHQDGLGTLVDVFGSPDTASCLTAAAAGRRHHHRRHHVRPRRLRHHERERPRPRRPERLADVVDPLRVRRRQHRFPLGGRGRRASTGRWRSPSPTGAPTPSPTSPPRTPSPRSSTRSSPPPP